MWSHESYDDLTIANEVSSHVVSIPRTMKGLLPLKDSLEFDRAFGGLIDDVVGCWSDAIGVELWNDRMNKLLDCLLAWLLHLETVWLKHIREWLTDRRIDWLIVRKYIVVNQQSPRDCLAQLLEIWFQLSISRSNLVVIESLSQQMTSDLTNTMQIYESSTNLLCNNVTINCQWTIDMKMTMK